MIMGIGWLLTRILRMGVGGSELCNNLLRQLFCFVKHLCVLLLSCESCLNYVIMSIEWMGSFLFYE